MTTQNLLYKNYIQKEYLKKNSLKKLLKNFNQSFLEIENEVKNTKKTLSVLSNNFTFNFKKKDLDKFKKFKTISIIGMGGSILGAESIYQFLKDKIKKKIYFFDDIDQEKILNFKKKINLKSVLFIVISKSGETIETLSNSFFLKIFKKNSKNVIIISEKKIIIYTNCLINLICFI